MKKIIKISLFLLLLNLSVQVHAWHPFENGFYIHPDNMPRFEIGTKMGAMQVSHFIFAGPFVEVNGENVSYSVHGSYIGGDFDTAGFYFTFWKSDNFGYQIEVLYYEKTAKTSFQSDWFVQSDEYQVDLGYLEFPFFAKLSILRRMLSVYGGGFVAANIYSRFGSQTVQFGVAPIDMGLLGGVEFAYFSNPHFRHFVDIRYELSMLNIVQNNSGSLRTGSFIASIGTSINF